MTNFETKIYQYVVENFDTDQYNDHDESYQPQNDITMNNNEVSFIGQNTDNYDQYTEYDQSRINYRNNDNVSVSNLSRQ